MNRPAHRRVLGLIAATALVVVTACNGGDDSTEPTSSAPVTTAASTSTLGATTTTAAPTAAALAGAPRQLPAFADFPGVPLLDDSVPYAGPPTPTSLDGVRMPDWLQARLQEDPALAALLAGQGFAIDADGFPFFHSRYESLSYGVDTVYVTTDVAYHVWHLAFAKVLRDTEEQVLAPALGELLGGLVDAARAQADELSGGPLADAAERVVAYYEAAATLLGVDVGTIGALATEEVRLATDAAELTTSPITGVTPCQAPRSFVGCVDFTLLRPRGHYTRSEAMERYFRAMGLLGQEAFYVDDVDSLRMGMLAARLVTEDPALAEQWRAIYEPTAFLVGVADDYTPFELQDAATSVLADGLADPGAFDDEAVAAVGEELIGTRPVGIDPENASVRTMGARLTLDSFVLDQLAWPNVGTEDDRRVHVSALDLASVFGSPLATELQAEAGEPDYANYDQQLDAMRELVATRGPADWAGTVYDAWLYAIEPQYAPRSVAYPDYMRTPEWAAKSLQTGFASYTELKHDTVLYSKQGTGAEGEGPPEPGYDPYHTVEPDPVAFGRIAAVAALARDGLVARDLLSSQSTALLDAVEELCSWLAGIAADELAAKVTSDADLARLAGIGSELELLWFEASDLPEDMGAVPSPDDRAALVADIFRSSFEYLELGTGWIDTIYVVVPDPDGEFQIAIGAVSSYYEFWRPTTEQRLTDEEWHALLDTGTQPPRPAWQAPILFGGDVATTTPVFQEVG